jgi:glycerol-3-phosphate dehydrogenase (NAD(P)+)
MNVSVLGAGAWGTALALVLHQNGHTITVWGHDPLHLENMRASRRNEAYLPGCVIPDDWRFETAPDRCVAGADLILMVVPSKAFRDVARSLGPVHAPLVTATKGIERDSGLTMGGVLESLFPHTPVAALSGPSLAPEVARGIPTAVVTASPDPNTAAQVQEAFHRPHFRVYRTTDRIGVELGGALKNILAIGAGVCDGLGFGDNSKAALVTRGQTEIRRLGVACGARPETFSGLSGLGDLTVTCFSKMSRNRTLGERLGRGETLAQATAATASIAEGVPTCAAAVRVADQRNVEIPIIREIHAMLFENKDVHQGVRDLLARDLKVED